MEKTQSAQVARQLKDKNADKPCPRCGHVHFSVVGETGVGVNPTGMAGLNAGHIPAVIVACSKCGFLSLHATAILDRHLGLLGGALS
jgi:ribosomal protein S27AE